MSLIHPLRQIIQNGLDILLPPLCLSCDAEVGGHGTLCPSCFGKIHFIAAPYCACCGLPFDIPIAGEMMCGSCLNQHPPYQTARAAMLYDDASKPLILGFKHGDQTHRAKAMAGWMGRAASASLAECDVIIPVPLHRWRLFSRRYNQAALLALHIGWLYGKTVWTDGLLRIRPTPSQGHRNRQERRANIKNAFQVSARYRPALAGKTILLVDDVLTTGSTVEECSKTLREAGAAAIHILTLARVRTAT